ncbi:hypothetical protein CAEBREN_15840 [Caenorhabditis brenneri]|uniref:Uncharacterized protein n=1 Tax=Caenorhabditis brenneri TaxID=135651 RepID=G0N6R3_CAEBE|nr:hypothetical protein CAEBREN_15840 [Caenorhabditis brenneri]
MAMDMEELMETVRIAVNSSDAMTKKGRGTPPSGPSGRLEDFALSSALVSWGETGFDNGVTISEKKS